jgi:hypothetical protein
MRPHWSKLIVFLVVLIMMKEWAMAEIVAVNEDAK